jgi:DNA-binding PadR family transcriptional regulator
MDNKLLLLGLLRKQEMHGYQLNEFIERDLAFCTDIKKPTAYYLLNKMTADGLILEEVVQAGNRPPRRVFHLTAQGEQAFQALLRENLSAFTPTYFPGDLGLAFLDELSPQEALELIQNQRDTLVKELEKTQTVPVHQGSIQLVVEHRRRYLQNELEWLDGIIIKIQSKEN